MKYGVAILSEIIVIFDGKCELCKNSISWVSKKLKISAIVPKKFLWFMRIKLLAVPMQSPYYLSYAEIESRR